VEEREFERLFKLGQEGMYLESIGNIEESIKIFEYMVEHHWEGSHVYERLSIYYKKQKRYNDVKRVCTTYINYYSEWLKKYHNYTNEMVVKDNKYLKFQNRLVSIEKYL
jgi:hypothetical protein